MTNKGDLPKFDPEIYTKFSLNDLIVYSIHHLHKRGGEVTSEDIISACFRLFPRRFSLHKYPHWPDSAVVTRRWSDIRAKGYMVGNTARGFKLTAKGIRFAGKLGKLLTGKRSAPAYTVPADLRTRAGRFVRGMETSGAFAHFKKEGLNARIGEFDFRDLLLCTMESTSETLKRNLEQFKEYAAIYDRQDLLTFLNFCEDRFAHLLTTDQRRPLKTARRPRL
jgi:hypothetical protein